MDVCAWVCGHVHIHFKTFSRTADNSSPEPPNTPFLRLEMTFLLPRAAANVFPRIISVLIGLVSAFPDPPSLASSPQPLCSCHAKLLNTQAELTRATAGDPKGSALPPWGEEGERALCLQPQAWVPFTCPWPNTHRCSPWMNTTTLILCAHHIPFLFMAIF